MSVPLSNIYNRLPVSFTHGKGSWLWDTEGRRYLDALAGIGVSCLGHAHPKLVDAIHRQASQLLHTSNIYQVEQQKALAQRITQLSNMQEVAFCNSGSEANEIAIKLARYYGHQQGNSHAHILTMQGAWHGRTLATLAATDSEKGRKGFEPLPTGFIKIPYNNLEALEKAALSEPRINAILLETIQGEGGIRPADIAYLQHLRQWCSQRGWLLMIDEVQSGVGRTGKWFAHQWADITPDVMTLAKGLGGGIPIGALVANGPAAHVLTPGSHGSTFGGNPLACAAALAVLDTLEQEDLLVNAYEIGDYLKRLFTDRLVGIEGVVQIRGQGLMLGIELNRCCTDLVKQALQAGLLINVTRDCVIRLLPPLILTRSEAAEIGQILVDLIIKFLGQ